MWALIKNNKIENVIVLDNPADYTPPADCNLVEITTGGIGWGYVNGQVVEPVTPAPTLSEAVATKLAALATYRFGKETGGINVNGTQIFTDRESQATLTGAYVAVQLNTARLIDWKASDGSWTQIDKATVEFLANAVADHVQACFSTEKAKSAEIQSLTTVEAVLEYDVTVGW